MSGHLLTLVVLYFKKGSLASKLLLLIYFDTIAENLRETARAKRIRCFKTCFAGFWLANS